jgi:hypothetical protein
MKTYIFVFLALLMLGLNASGYYYDYSTSAYYSVFFDERGLANVVLRLDYAHAGNDISDSIFLDIPGKNVSVLKAFIREKCDANDSSCYYYYNFKPVDVTKVSEGKYKIDLDRTLGKGESADLLIYYRGFGYVKGGLLGSDFDFETIEFDFDVDSTRVSINVDDDLYLKQGESKGDYTRTMYQTEGSAGIQQALSSSYSYVGYVPGFVKQKSTLLAGETFHVCGTYGKNNIVLHLPEIVGLLFALVLGGWFLRKHLKTGKKIEKRENLAESAVFSFTAAVAFGLILSLIVLLSLMLDISHSNAQPAMLSVIIMWLASAGVIYAYKKKQGTGLLCALMYVGFSVIITPFMLLLAVYTYVAIKPPYYYY